MHHVSSKQSLDRTRTTGISRLIRQVCLLREQGDAIGAGQLEKTAFANAVRDFRLAHGPAALPESELLAMFATEEQRVADAVALSELLIPRLVGTLPATAAASRIFPETRPLTARNSGPAASPSAIPDLLDAMLAAERNRCQPPANKRVP